MAENLEFVSKSTGTYLNRIADYFKAMNIFSPRKAVGIC